MTFAEYLTSTRTLSWVDRKYHLRWLEQAIADFEVAAIRKIYLLGYAEANAQALPNIVQCVEAKSACGLKRIFDSLPHGHDELGLTVIGDMLNVYLLLPISKDPMLYVVDFNHRTVYQRAVPNFPYYFLFDKRIVYPPLSLLPQS
jgi:hypothetical protein